MLNSIHSVKDSFSKANRYLDQVFRNSIERVKEVSVKKAPFYQKDSFWCKSADSTYGLKVESKQYIDNIKVHYREYFNEFIPTIRLIHQREKSEEDLRLNASVKNNLNEIRRAFEKRKAEEPNGFLKQYHQNRLQMEMKKLNESSVIEYKYNPNYKFIHKKTPSILFDSKRYSEEIISKAKRIAEQNKAKLNEENTLKYYSKRNLSKDPLKKGKNQPEDDKPINKPLANRSSSSLVQVAKEDNGKNVPQQVRADSTRDIRPVKRLKSSKSFQMKKMIGRNSNLMINDTLNVPSLGTYNPNYSYFENNKQSFSFNPRNSLSGKKKATMNKLIHSYNVNEGYSLMRFQIKSNRSNSLRKDERKII